MAAEPFDCGGSLQLAAQKLAAGMRVLLRPRGDSMAPRIYSGQLVVLEPHRHGDRVRRDDVVLVKVNGALYLHLVAQVQPDGRRVMIANARGHVNGWTRVENIFGKVI